jgi:Fe-S cluster biogenesis protein NfuA
MTESIENKIKEILETKVAPALAMDGGGITFEGYDSGIVKVKLQGACQGCPGAMMTLKMGVEARLKEDVPEIKEVVQV